MLPSRGSARRLRFFLLERVVLPVAVLLLRLWMATWRLSPSDESTLRPLRDSPRLVLGTCHGMLLHLVAFSRLPALRGRRFVVLLSPSLDGRLLAAFLARFGIDHAVGATERRGVGGAHDFARRVAAGEIGIIAVDGPRGPCCTVTPGFLRLAAAADAEVMLAVTTATRGITFGSWDRAHLPAPFARVRGRLEPLAVRRHESIDAALPAVQATLLEAARSLCSPVLPPHLRAESGENPGVLS